MNYIDTDKIIEGIRNYKPKVFGDRPHSIRINKLDIDYLKSNMGFAPVLERGKRLRIFDLIVVEDNKINIGDFKIFGKPRLKKWQ